MLKLVIAALRMALSSVSPRHNSLVHSDRGRQFASAAYRQVLAQHRSKHLTLVGAIAMLEEWRGRFG